MLITLAVALWPLAAQGSAIEQVRRMVLDWVQAWGQKDIQRYLAFYSPRFQPQGQQLQAWARQKPERFAATGPVTVEISDLSVFIEGSQASARFVQHYRSGSYADQGEKTLTLVRDQDRWQIVSETWETLDAAAGTVATVQPCQTNTVTDIAVTTDPQGADRLTVARACWGEPRITAVDGAEPFIFIDIPGPCRWEGPVSQTVAGGRIRRVRTLFPGADGLMRIRLDLAPGPDIQIDQIADRHRNRFIVEVR